MSDIGPGTESEYIGPERSEFGPSGLMIGAIYVCGALVPVGPDVCVLCGQTRLHIELTVEAPWVYCPCVFRPIRDGQERIERAVKICEPA